MPQPSMLAAGARYVALGSSFAAGPGIGHRAPGSPRRAGRSAANYAHLIAQRFGLDLDDVTYSGATTGDILTARPDGWPAQVDAVTADTRLATITCGGNDLGYVPRILLSSLPWPVRALPSVRRRADADADPELTQARFSELAGRLAQIAAEVHRRAPGCRLIFVDYLTLLPPDAATATGALPAEVAAWGRGVAGRLSEVTRAAAEHAAAEAAGCDFAPAGAASKDHHAWSADPWTRRFHLGLRDGAPYHPNAAGMAAVAALVADILTELTGRAGGLGEERASPKPEHQLALNERGRTLSSDQLFDTIGATYAATRPAEPRIAARIWAALGDACTVVNVGAGTGSYEPPDRDVTAVEPSAVMRAQRPAGAAPCVPGVAGSLPFADQSFDAAMAVLTDQHWPDVIAGYREMQRVARRVVTFHFDTSRLDGDFWLARDYLPEHAQLSAGRPTLTERASAIGARLEPVPIPWDCCDGNFPSYWRRPQAYLDEQVRRAVSVWHVVGRAVEERVVRDLRADLESGRWAERNSELLGRDEIDIGGRLLIA